MFAMRVPVGNPLSASAVSARPEFPPAGYRGWRFLRAHRQLFDGEVPRLTFGAHARGTSGARCVAELCLPTRVRLQCRAMAQRAMVRLCALQRVIYARAAIARRQFEECAILRLNWPDVEAATKGGVGMGPRSLYPPHK